MTLAQKVRINFVRILIWKFSRILTRDASRGGGGFKGRGPGQLNPKLLRAGTREPEGSEATSPSPSNLKAVRVSPTQLWTVNVVHFYFCVFLHVNLAHPKN